MIDKNKTLRKAIQYYGHFEQHSVCMEECGELIQAISKFLRATTATEMLKARKGIVEELTDVQICLDELRIMHDISDKELEDEYNFKLVRLNGRVEDGNIEDSV